MTTHRFNPLNYANDLKDVGFSDKQAEKLAQLQEEIVTNADNELVTKSYLSGELKILEVTIIKWMIGISFAQMGVILTLMGFLIKHS